MNICVSPVVFVVYVKFCSPNPLPNPHPLYLLRCADSSTFTNKKHTQKIDRKLINPYIHHISRIRRHFISSNKKACVGFAQD